MMRTKRAKALQCFRHLLSLHFRIVTSLATLRFVAEILSSQRCAKIKRALAHNLSRVQSLPRMMSNTLVMTQP